MRYCIEHLRRIFKRYEIGIWTFMFILALITFTLLSPIIVNANNIQEKKIVSSIDGVYKVPVEDDNTINWENIFEILVYIRGDLFTISNNQIEINELTTSISDNSTKILDRLESIDEGIKSLSCNSLSGNTVSQLSVSYNSTTVVSNNSVSADRVEIMFEEYQKRNTLQNTVLVFVGIGIWGLWGFQIGSAFWKRMRS